MFRSLAKVVMGQHRPEYAVKILANHQQWRAASTKLLDVSVDDKSGVATVTMQRPPVNSLNLQLLQDFNSAMQELENNRCKGMILTSGLKSVFCAGLDITEMYKAEPERLKTFWTAFQDAWLNLYGSSFPTVAVINGHSPAGGCVLALSCEYRVMVGPKFNIGLNETQVGIVAPKWVMETMIRTISKRKAELALINGSMFTAEEAVQNGIVDKLAVDTSDALSCAQEYLSISMKVPATARKLTKMVLRGDIIEYLLKNREYDSETFLGFVTQPAQQDWMGKYLESLKKK